MVNMATCKPRSIPICTGHCLHIVLPLYKKENKLTALKEVGIMRATKAFLLKARLAELKASREAVDAEYKDTVRQLPLEAQTALMSLHDA
ncbi:hypothetical protein WJX81_007171 [Elliptochloris bilobata]|uniref:Uncharacterized protein n=1 Tax=Elliptochloris bilobata TaxID=381761 RepID=A0AAW1SKB1_9CHLO